MKTFATHTLPILLFCYLVVLSSSKKDDRVYVKEWAVKVQGGERVARDVAEDHGFRFVGQVS